MTKEAPVTYRRRRGSYDAWHFCTNCSNWPTYDYEERHTKPNDGELDNECRSKQANGTCQS